MRTKPRLVRDTVTDDVVAGCLARIRRRDMAAVGVLADYLEENRLPGAKSVRAAWDDLNRELDYWRTAKISPRKWYVNWQAVAWSYRRCWGKIRRLYGRRWRLPMSEKSLKLFQEKPQ